MKTRSATKALFLFILMIMPISLGYANLYQRLSPRLQQDPYFSSYKLQFAGEIGMLSFGLGKTLRPWYEYTIMYGYVPSFNDAYDIHSLALKQDFTLFRYQDQYRLYFDFSILLALGQHYWPAFHTKGMPKWYYYESGLEGIMAMGIEYRFNNAGEWKSFKAKNMALYAEAGLLAHWLVFYYQNPHTVELRDMATITFGLNYYFR